MFDFVGVFGGVGIDMVYVVIFRSVEDINLSFVDIVVYIVESSDDDYGGEMDVEGFEVMKFVNGIGIYGVLVKSVYGLVERIVFFMEFSVVMFMCFGEKNLVVGLGVLRER